METPLRRAWLNRRGWLAAAALAPPVWLASAAVWPPAWPVVWSWGLGRAWIGNVLVYPVLEEIVFRAGLQAWLLQRPGGAVRRLGLSGANLLAAAVFAAAHLFTHPPGWALAVFVPGLIFGWSYERWGLSSAVALHVWYNFGYFTLYPPPA